MPASAYNWFLLTCLQKNRQGMQELSNFKIAFLPGFDY